ncbi:MAG: hypothetical protein HFH80_01330 [Lachnospiraceae bacterium]|nr:hypothetical protein [Lachnospiraceae bacterium]
MTFFEQELQRIFGKDMGLSDIRIVGNACYGRLSGDICLKAKFVAVSKANYYDVLKVTMLNRHEGPIDCVRLHFSDLWGRKKVNNPDFRDGIHAHIWKNGGKTEWYVYKPTDADFRQLSGAVSDYLDVFREPVQEPQMEQRMC